MVRFMAPYMAVALVIAGFAGYGYGRGTLSAVAVYGVGLVAIIVADIGFERWEERNTYRRR